MPLQFVAIHWVQFFLNGVAETATKGRDVFRQILTLRTEAERAIMDLGKRTTIAHRALNLLYRKPIMDASELKKALEISTPTANKLIGTLIEKRILVEMTGQQRGRVYAFDRYLKLFLN